MKKFFKKPVAIVLAVLLAFSSVSVAVSAIAAEKITFTTKFFNADGTEIESAKCGDSVTAKVYIDSEFTVGSMALMFAYNSNMLALNTAGKATSGSGYAIETEDGVGGYYKDGSSQMAGVYETGRMTAAEMTNRESIYVAVNTFVCKKYDETTSGKALLKFDFTVKSKDVVSLEEDGILYFLEKTIITPDDFENDVWLPSNITKIDGSDNVGKSQATYNVDDSETSEYYYVDVTNENSKLSVAGLINYVTGEYGTLTEGEGAKTDAASGVTINKVNDGEYTAEYYNGEALGDTPTVTLTEKAGTDGKVFKGWASTAENATAGTVLNATELAAYTYSPKNDAKTLYASYEYADAKYSVEIYEMGTDGYYPTSATKTETGIATKVANEITLAEALAAASYTVEAGFTTDDTTPANVAKITAQVKEDNNVYKIYVAREEYKLTIKLDGDEFSKEDVYYGAKFTLPTDADLNNTDSSSKYYGRTIDTSKWTGVPAGNVMPAAATEINGTTKGVPVNVYYANGVTTDPISGEEVSGTWTGEFIAATEYGSATPAPSGTYTAPDGFKVTSWKNAQTGTATATDIAGLSAFTVDKDNYTIIDNTTPWGVYIVPVLEKKTGTVTFDANGGTFKDTGKAQTSSSVLNYGDAISDGIAISPDDDINPAHPVDDNTYDLKFKGWAATSDGEVISTDIAGLGKFKDDTTFFAIWEDDRLTITWQGPDSVTETKVAPNTILTEKDAPSIADIEGKEWQWTIPSDPITAATTVNGTYVPKKYNATFYLDGVKYDTNSKQYEYEAVVDYAEPVSKTGYTFDGWYLAADCTGTKASTTYPTMPAKDIDVYGKYNINVHKITYYIGTENKGSDDVTYDDTIVLRKDAEKEGNSFSGWTLYEVDGATPYTDAKMPDRDLVAKGDFSKNQYNIVYVNTKTDEIVKIITKYYDTTLDASEAADDLPDAADKSYKFVKWSQDLPASMGAYTDSYTGTYEGNPVTVEDALVIKSIWNDMEKVKYTFEHKDGTTETKEGYPETDIDFPEFTANDKKDGYTTEWDTTETQYGETDTTIKIKQTAKDVNVTFDNGTSDDADPEGQKVAFDGMITKPADPTNGTLELLGWYVDGKEFDFTKPIEDQIDYSEDITLKAKYGVTDTYHFATAVTPAGDYTYEGSVMFDAEEDVISTKTYAVPNTYVGDIEGFKFVGWAATEGGTVLEGEDAPDGTFSTASRNYYAIYEIQQYTLSYKVDGEDYTTPEKVTFASPISVPADPEAPAGYKFAGWEDKDGKGPSDYGTMPAHDVTFNATFKADTHTVTYLSKDWKGQEYTYDVENIDGGMPVIVPEDPTRIGYKFTGWKDANGNDVPETMPSEDLVFTAQWELDEKVIYYTIGGTVVVGTVVAAAFAANTALITGAAIVGGIVIIGGGVILAKHTHKVTFVVDDDVYRTYYIVEGTKIIVPDDPTKDGYEFDGWDPEIPEKMGEEDLTFTAKWVAGASEDIDTDDDEPADIDVPIPDTGSAFAGLAAFATISTAAAAAYVIKRKKNDD